jgi:CspA family cold shock protein
MPIGRVKWYDKAKGYGFIECPEGDVFFHFSDILMEGFKALAEDQRVSYKMVRGPSGLKAKEIQPLDNRASVKSAARYRTVLLMVISEGNEDEFDRVMSHIPAFLDEVEQDIGLRRVGAWRHGRQAVRLIESDRPYKQAMEKIEKHPKREAFTRWGEKLAALLDDGPTVMSPILGDGGRE